MKAALERLGFEVDILANPDRRAFNVGISAFTQKLKAGDTALVHYSGHGLAVDGENYLLPADVPQPGASDKELHQVGGGAAVDPDRARARVRRACANPHHRCLPRQPLRQCRHALGRRARRPRQHPAAARGRAASSSSIRPATARPPPTGCPTPMPEPTSVYTRILLRKLAVEGKPITDLAREVREDVEALAATIKHDQRPAYYDELSGPPFYFRPPSAAAQQAASRDVELRVLELDQGFAHGGAVPRLPREVRRARRVCLDRTREAPRARGPAGRRRDGPAEGRAIDRRPPLRLRRHRRPPSRQGRRCRSRRSPRPSSRASTAAPASGPSERAICGNAGLAARDRVLARQFYRLIEGMERGRAAGAAQRAARLARPPARLRARARGDLAALPRARLRPAHRRAARPAPGRRRSRACSAPPRRRPTRASNASRVSTPSSRRSAPIPRSRPRTAPWPTSTAGSRAGSPPKCARRSSRRSARGSAAATSAAIPAWRPASRAPMTPAFASSKAR